MLDLEGSWTALGSWQEEVIPAGRTRVWVHDNGVLSSNHFVYVATALVLCQTSFKCRSYLI